MIKQIYKYPYNARTEDEIKVFLSDRICEQVMKIIYKNGQIFYIIKDRVSSKNKEILLSAVIFFGALLVMPAESPAIGVPIRLRFSSTPEIHRPVPEYFPKYAATINPRVEKIIMLTNNKRIPLIYINGHYSYINEQLLRKLRAGDLSSASLTVVTIGVIVYVMCQLLGIDAFTIIRELGRLNAPTIDPHPRFGLNPTTPSRPGLTLRLTRPTAMPHEKFVGLTKEEQRALPHINDTAIIHEGHPDLKVGFWQSDFKVSDHGAVHDLPIL
jgi:hypothetical protein